MTNSPFFFLGEKKQHTHRSSDFTLSCQLSELRYIMLSLHWRSGYYTEYGRAYLKCTHSRGTTLCVDIVAPYSMGTDCFFKQSHSFKNLSRHD